MPVFSFAVARTAVVLVVLLFSIVAYAKESSDTLFSAATKAFKKNDFELALQLFELSYSRGMDTPMLHYNIGVTQYKLGQFQEAYLSLKKAALDPGFASLGHFNMGLAAVKLQESGVAEKQFQLAAENATQEKQRELAEYARNQVRLSRNNYHSGGWHAAIQSRLGYNDNVILENANYTIDPVGEGDQYLGISAYLSKPLTDSIRLRSNLFIREYNEIQVYNFSKIDLGIRYKVPYESWNISTSYKLERNTLDGLDFQNINTLELSLARNNLHRAIHGITLTYSKIQQYDNRYAYLQGSVWQLAGKIGVREADRLLFFQFAVEDNNRGDYQDGDELIASYSPTRYKVGINASSSWFNGSSLDVSLHYQISEHRSANLIYENTTVKRIDDRIVFNFGVLYPLINKVWLTASYRHLKNDSNIATYIYTSNQITGGFVWRL